MGFFDYLQSSGTSALRAQGPTVREELVVKPKKPINKRLGLQSSSLLPPLPSSASLATPRSRRLNGSRSESRTASPRSRASNSPAAAGAAREQQQQQHHHHRDTRRRRLTPLSARLASSSDDSEGGDDNDATKHRAKRPRSSSVTRRKVDTNRRLRADVIRREADDPVLELVHAAEIASVAQANKYVPAFDGSSEDLSVELQYPGSTLRERYACVSLASTLESERTSF